MSTESRSYFKRSAGSVAFLGSQTRPVITALILMVLVTSSFAAADAVISQNADASVDADANVQEIGDDDFTSESVINESGTSINETATDTPAVNGVESGGANSSSANTSIKIETHSQTTVDGQTIESDPEVVINGQSIDLPSSGTYRQDIRDDDSRTRIRARVDTDNTSINISTNESVESGSD